MDKGFIILRSQLDWLREDVKDMKRMLTKVCKAVKVEDPITVLVMDVGKNPEIIDVPNKLKTFQRLVDGYIETVSLGDGAIMVCNEDGKHTQPVNRPWRAPDGSVLDMIHGNFFICCEDGEDFTSITPQLVLKYGQEFALEKAKRAE